jgi:homoserine dehydrogenase
MVIPLTDPLASVTEGSTAVTITSDFLQELTILIKDPGIRQTAYAVVIDLLTIVRSL